MTVTIPYEIILTILGFSMIVLWFIFNKLSIIKNMGCILLMIIGTGILVNGITNVDALINLALGIIDIAAGFFYMLYDSFSYTNQSRFFEIEEDGRYH